MQSAAMKEKAPKSAENVRLQIELAKSKVQRFEKLMKLCGITTKKELVNYALTILEWAVEETYKGSRIVSVNETDNRYRELSMPFLSEAAAMGKLESVAEDEASTEQDLLVAE